MATRCAIGFLEHDGSVHGVYCHHDGYLEGVGARLIAHYSDTYKLLELLEHGSISVLGERIGVKKDFNSYDYKSGECLFYHRDRDEPTRFTEAVDFDSADDFADYFANSGCEYLYLYDGREWTYARRDFVEKVQFRPLTINLTGVN